MVYLYFFRLLTYFYLFYSFHVLNVSTGIDDVGHLQWPLALCMLASSMLTFFTLIKGVKSIGKVGMQTEFSCRH